MNEKSNTLRSDADILKCQILSALIPTTAEPSSKPVSVNPGA
jgi:hypothetical protein